jgi:hypothetical protein
MRSAPKARRSRRGAVLDDGTPTANPEKVMFDLDLDVFVSLLAVLNPVLAPDLPAADRLRNLIARAFCRLKDWRRIAILDNELATTLPPSASPSLSSGGSEWVQTLLARAGWPGRRRVPVGVAGLREDAERGWIDASRAYDMVCEERPPHQAARQGRDGCSQHAVARDQKEV